MNCTITARIVTEFFNDVQFWKFPLNSTISGYFSINCPITKRTTMETFSIPLYLAAVASSDNYLNIIAFINSLCLYNYQFIAAVK